MPRDTWNIGQPSKEFVPIGRNPLGFGSSGKGRVNPVKPKKPVSPSYSTEAGISLMNNPVTKTQPSKPAPTLWKPPSNNRSNTASSASNVLDNIRKGLIDKGTSNVRHDFGGSGSGSKAMSHEDIMKRHRAIMEEQAKLDKLNEESDSTGNTETGTGKKYDWGTVKTEIGGKEGPYGGGWDSRWDQKGNYYETDPGKGHYTTAGGGRKKLGDPRVDYAGPGFQYWNKDNDAAIAAYTKADTETKRRMDLMANAESNRPAGAIAYGEYKQYGGDWQGYIDYLNKFEATEGGQAGSPGGGTKGGSGEYSGSENINTGMDSLVFPIFEMTDEMSIQKQLPQLINTNSPLFKAATTRIMQDMQKRGIANSSIAQGAALQAVTSLAMDILREDTKKLYDAGVLNHNAATARFMKQMDYGVQILLKQISEGGQMSRLLIEQKGDNYRKKLASLATLMANEDADVSTWSEYLRIIGGV